MMVRQSFFPTETRRDYACLYNKVLRFRSLCRSFLLDVESYPFGCASSRYQYFPCYALAFRYTQYVNRLYKRVGHLFQRRFKSILVDDEDYLKELIRYIHLNPVRTNLVPFPQQYSWSSLRAYMGLDEFCWLTKDRVFKKFNFERENAVKNFEKYVLQGIGVETDSDFKFGHSEGILGNQDFIDDIMVKISKIQQRKIKLTNLAEKVCEINDITQEQLCMPGKLAKQARALLVFLVFLVREIDCISLENLAQFLERDSNTLAQLASRFEIKIAKDPLAAYNVEMLRDWLKKGV